MKKKTDRNYLKQYIDNCSISKCIICSIIVCIALLIIDRVNYFTVLIQKAGLGLFVALLVGALSIIIIVLSKRIWLSLKYKITNTIDSVLFVLFFIIPLYVIGTILIDSSALYKFITSLILFVLVVVLLFIRFLMCNQYDQKAEKLKEIDLKDILENSIDKNADKPLIIAEKDVDYDLLERKGIINNLYSSITKCVSGGSFVIGLEGEWGSGKTTIINNVKRIIQESNTDIRIIDDFDPWTYGSEKALLSAFYDSIMIHSNMKSSDYSSRKAIDEISSIISDNYVQGGIAKALLNLTRNSETEVINQLKKRIAAFLSENKISIVVFIDNIDRANSENIIFLMKIISVIFNIPHIVYVLAYDKARMTEIMSESLSINPKYTEKIINQVITIPEIQSEKMKSVFSVCFDNLLQYYDVGENSLKDFQPIKDYICKRVKNLRQFKRLINSVFTTVFIDKTSLQLFDLVSMQVILFEENEVYNLIYENKQYFISEDIMYDRELVHTVYDTDNFNESGKVFFDDFSKIASPECFELLSYLFPYVKQYKSNKELKEKYSIKSSNRLKAISSAKYFELYFSYGSNDYLSINKSVEDSIDIINKSTDYNTIDAAFSNALFIMPPQYQHEWVLQINLRIEEIDFRKRFDCIRVLYNNTDSLDDGLYFMQLSPREIVIAIIANLLLICSRNEANQFFESIKNDYSKIGIIRKIAYWLKADHYKNEEFGEEVVVLANKIHESLISEIINKKIDIYSNEYYSYKNINGLYANDENHRLSDLKEYISSIASKDNIIRIMADMINVSYGGVYTYYFSSDTIDLFFNDISEMEKYLSNYTPKNDSEQFVLDVYYKYKDGQPDEWGKKSITLNHQFIFDL